MLGPVLPHPPALVPLLGARPSRLRPKLQLSSSNWQRAKAVRATINSPLDEGEQILVQPVLVGRGQAMRGVLVDLEGRVRDQL